jgi:hypothetical protein
MENYLLLFSVFLVLIIILIYWYFSQNNNLWRKNVKAKLAGLDKLSKTDEIYRLKSIVMEADKLLDYALKNRGVKGETLGERLKNAKKLIDWKDYQNAWEGHKLRNKMAHEMDFTPTSKDLKEKYEFLRTAIKKL